MHAADSRALGAAQDRLRAAEDAIRVARDEAASATATLLTERQAWAAREATLAREAADAVSVASDLRHQNGLLHSQLVRLAAAADGTQTRLRTRLLPSGSGVDSAGTESVADATSAAISEEDVSALRTSVRQLREVVSSMHHSNQVRSLYTCYKSRDRHVLGFFSASMQLLESKADLAEQRVSSLSEMLAATQRALDEARATAAAASESAAAGVQGLSSADNSARLSQALSELTLLRESNNGLRGDAAAANGRAAAAERRVADLDASILPLQQRIRISEAEIVALTAECKRSSEEVAMWRARLDSVLSR